MIESIVFCSKPRYKPFVFYSVLCRWKYFYVNGLIRRHRHCELFENESLSAISMPYNSRDAFNIGHWFSFQLNISWNQVLCFVIRTEYLPVMNNSCLAVIFHQFLGRLDRTRQTLFLIRILDCMSNQEVITECKTNLIRIRKNNH